MKEKQQRRPKKMQNPSVYEYKTAYQANVERFSSEVADNSRKIKESEDLPQPQKKSNPQAPKKSVEHMILTFS